MGADITTSAPAAGGARRIPAAGPGRREQAFVAAVTVHGTELARFAYSLCGDRWLAEDVVAEACASVWPRWRRGQVDDLVPYLRRAVVHQVYGRSRRMRLVRREQERRTAPAADGRFDGRLADRHVLWTALDRLPREQRVVVVLRVAEDLSEQEVAAMVGVPVGTVKSRLARGLAVLRTTMEATDA